MKIGQLADVTGVSTKAIRYYEQIGVLPEPERESNGYRIYNKGAADRLSFIQDSQTAGLSLLEIQMILDLRNGGDNTCNHVIGTLQSHVDQVERQMSELIRTRKRLLNLIKRAESLDPVDCNDPNRCQTIPKGKH